MKKLLFSAVALTAVTITSASAQAFEGFSFGPKTGVNISSFTDADNTKALLGLTAGAFAEYGLNNWFALSADVLYSRQGVAFKDYSFEGVNYSDKATLDYLNVPVLANFYIAKGLALKAGLQPGFLLGAKNISEANGQKETVDMKDVTNSFDLSVPVGISYSLNCGLIIDARYNIGVTKLPKEDLDNDGYSDGLNSRNGVFTVALGWRF